MTTESGFTFTMPSLGADMESGRITEWLVAPGDVVTAGQLVAVVETEKADIDVEVFHPGVVEELLVPTGAQVPVGTPIARFRSPTSASPPTATKPVMAPPPSPIVATSPPEPLVAGAARAVTSPLIRHLADELHVDLTSVHGSEIGGRIGRDDVLAAGRSSGHPGRRLSPRARRLAAESGVSLDRLPSDRPVTGADVLALAAEVTSTMPAPGARPPASAPATRNRSAIAALMTRSWSEIPHFHVSSQLDVTTALQDLAEFNRTRSVAERVLPAALLLRAVAAAARRVPAVNGWWSNDHVEPAAEVDLGVVVSLRGGGLLVPTIRQADRLDRSAMMVRLAEITNRARLGRLRGSDLEPASITVSSLGDRAGEALAGIIHPPQIALVGLGSVREAPWAERGVLSARSVVTVTVAGDHRAIDGAVAASFLSAMASALAAPYEPQGSS